MAGNEDWLNLKAFRAATPAAAVGVHLNAASAGLQPRAVQQAVAEQLDLELLKGPHAAMAHAAVRIEPVREAVAELLGRMPDEIAFGETSGRLWAMAFHALRLSPGAKIIVSRGEWGSNVLNILRRRQLEDIEVAVVERGRDGQLIVDHLRHLIDERTQAICMPVVESATGFRQPVEAVGALPRPDSCLFFVDGAQAVGRFPVDAMALNADILVAPARKWLRGPRGQALMALSPRALEILGDPPIIDQLAGTTFGWDGYALRDVSRRFEAYEFSWAARLGLGAAIRHVQSWGIAAIAAAIDARVAQICQGLQAIPGVQVWEAQADRPAFLTFALANHEASSVTARLAQSDITIATLDWRTTRLNFEPPRTCNRVAPHAYTTEADIARFLDAIHSLASL
ncbi:Selenocysteine lyase/Cysteine desulfurase [Arboricoccus pini]|uniref:Selenocysteine lyase/Cysteine desulfurase n=1 Tax=Arboricoccus pini TaxID=1963835 RepID=A0A212RV27_9PROT|nr:aminotransferase class V-fold PLP-dependent enzyme [Arboricoccus pini]SNB76584.1 Selenocysteine lyase/Cysteine desulfurase [Arboricoccus pini]